MFAFIKRKCLRCQSVFWLTLTFICSFLILSAVNYKYHSNFLQAEQWDRLESATDLIATSPVFEYMSHNLGDPDDVTVKDFFTFLNAFEAETFLDGYFVFYSDNDIYLVKSADSVIPFIKEQTIPMDVMKACNNVFYTGAVEEVTCDHVNYFVKPVVWNKSGKKFGICTYASTEVVDANLQWFMRATSRSIIVVLFSICILLFFVVNTVIFEPLKKIISIVDLFVYQSFEGYLTVTDPDANEVVHLRTSLKRVENLLITLRTQMAESKRFRNWICNVTRDKKHSIFSGTVEFMALADKELPVGNLFAWNKRQSELNDLISKNGLKSLYFCYVRVLANTDLLVFINEALTAAGIEDFPLNSAFRLAEDAFLFTFESEKKLSGLVDWLKENNCKFGTATFVPEEHFSTGDLLAASISNLG